MDYEQCLAELSEHITPKSPQAHSFLCYVRGLKPTLPTTELDDAWAACKAVEDILAVDLTLVQAVYERLRKTLQ